MGRWDHPLLGIRLEMSKPSWNGDLESTSLTGSPTTSSATRSSFRVRDMSRWRWRRLGTVPDRSLRAGGDRIPEIPGSRSEPFAAVQVELDPASSEFDVHVRSDPASSDVGRACPHPGQGLGTAFESRARPRRNSPALSRRLLTARNVTGGLRSPATIYGPTFQGIERLWRGEREDLAEIYVPSGLMRILSDYRLHPAVLDACFQTMLALLPIWNSGRA